MNWNLIGELIRLRYKLMWAKTRSRNGKIALFAIGYLLFVMIAALLAAGGFGAGILAIQSGKAEKVADLVLSALFVNAIFATVLMGFGMSAHFSDAELRRYPVYARERFVARHFLGIVDPFWFFILALEMGLVLGLYIYGSYSLWNGVLAVLLLFACSYLCTRVLGLWIDQLMATRSGSAAVLMLIMCISLAPATAMAILARNPMLVPKIIGVLRLTPPFGAATAMTHNGWEMFYGLAIVGGWMLLLAALLAQLEQRPVGSRQTARETGSLWDSRLDHIATLFGPAMAPLVGHWLRFYLRNSRFRILYSFSLPLAAFLAYATSRPRSSQGSLFLGALGSLGIVTFLGTARIALNQFGYVGGGFRRFFLFPTNPGASLRAGSYAAVLLGAVWIPPAAILWALFAPRPFDLRIVLMPVINAITALFVFHGIGLWTSLYAPRRGNYDRTIGNDMSLVGNIALIGSALGCILLPERLHAVAPWMVAPENWWLTVVPAGIGVVFYVGSLRAASAALPSRREALLAVVEGRA
jgi:hypothetical protein